MLLRVFGSGPRLRSGFSRPRLLFRPWRRLLLRRGVLRIWTRLRRGPRLLWPRVFLRVSLFLRSRRGSRMSFGARLHGISRPWLSGIGLRLRIVPGLHRAVWPRFARLGFPGSWFSWSWFSWSCFPRSGFHRVRRPWRHGVWRARPICQYRPHYRGRGDSVVCGDRLRGRERLGLVVVYRRELRAVGGRLAP